jgi:hypothetical protein
MQMVNENLAKNPSVKKKHFPVFTAISFVLLAITLCLSVISLFIDLSKNQEHKLTLSEYFHIGLQRGSQHSVFGSIIFFNGEYPYVGSIVRLATREQPRSVRGWYLSIHGLGHETYSNDLGIEIEAMYCCDLPGIYYRYFKLPSSTIWTLTISLWLPMVIFSLLPGIQIWRCRRKKEIK